MKSKHALLVLVLIILGCVGCLNDGSGNSTKTEKGLKLTSVVTSIGGVGDDVTVEQVLSYEAYLLNDGDNEVYIAWAEPILGKLTEYLIAGDNRIIINKTLSPGTSIRISGKVRFSSKGLSKKQIVNLSPHFKGIKISSEQELLTK